MEPSEPTLVTMASNSVSSKGIGGSQSTASAVMRFCTTGTVMEGRRGREESWPWSSSSNNSFQSCFEEDGFGSMVSCFLVFFFFFRGDFLDCVKPVESTIFCMIIAGPRVQNYKLTLVHTMYTVNTTCVSMCRTF